MTNDTDPHNTDLDPQETEEWLDALESVIERDGPERAHFLIESLVGKARRRGAYLPYNATTAYLNTIPPSREAKRPGDPALERRVKSLIRWNAVAMVVKANRAGTGLGGHIATYQSAANLFEVGFNCARLPRGTHHRRADGELPSRGRRQGTLVIPASLADAGLLAVRHCVDGFDVDPGHLPGALPQVPA
jgi:pyruvate dehydrogenase complex dehydrogenase (E1) component